MIQSLKCLNYKDTVARKLVNMIVKLALLAKANALAS